MTAPSHADSHSPHLPTKRQRLARPWAVSAIAWLLLVEAGGLLFLAVINFRSVTAIAFIALAVLALGAAVGFARVRRGGWVNAVLVQGGELAMALILFLSARAAYSYLMMVYGILMALYLHQADVQAAFRLAPGPEQGPP